MSIPAGTKFIGIAADVDTYERKSAQANSPSNVYTIEDIVDGTVPDSRTITINGNTQDLTANRTWTISQLNPLVQSVTSAATVTPVATNDIIVITAQAVGLTLANPTGTWVQGQALMIRIKDNGSAQTIAYDTKFRAIGVTLPTTTTASKTTYLGVIYNATDDKFDVMGVTTEA